MGTIKKTSKKNEDKSFINEKWKMLQFDFRHTKKRSVEISNYGRVRSYSSPEKFNYLNGTDIKGYRIIKLKFFIPRTVDEENSIEKNKLKIIQHQKKYLKLLNSQEKSAEYKQHLKELKKDFESKKVARKLLLKKDEISRTIHFSKLIHRLVAEYFCKTKSPQHSLVTHLDFDKLNNKADNLKWVTQKQSTDLQKKNPLVIQSKLNKFGKRSASSKVYKLTEKEVKIIKKKLKNGKLISHLAAEYGVTQTQILRIKRGENWAGIPAAK